MKKKRLMIVGIMAALVIVIGAMAINQSPGWSEISFEAIHTHLAHGYKSRNLSFYEM